MLGTNFSTAQYWVYGENIPVYMFRMVSFPMLAM